MGGFQGTKNYETFIFCEDIDHAERMRAAIVNAAGDLAIENPKYVMRITGDSPDPDDGDVDDGDNGGEGIKKYIINGVPARIVA